MWVTGELESHQTARHIPVKSPAERELFRVQLTTSRSDFSGELSLKEKFLGRFLPPLFYWYPHKCTRSHVLSPSHFPSLRVTGSPPSLPAAWLSSSNPLPPVTIKDKPYIVVSGDTVSSPVPEQGWKLVTGVQRIRAMDLNLQAILVAVPWRGQSSHIWGRSFSCFCLPLRYGRNELAPFFVVQWQLMN